MKSNKPQWVTYDKIKWYQWIIVGAISTLGAVAIFFVWYWVTQK